ncbi:MAG: Ig-like domain-containing protein [Galbitalea sp.]
MNVDLSNPVVHPVFTTTTRTASATATDIGSGVASISWRTSGGTWAAYTGPIALGSAAASLEFEATDVAGHVSPVVDLSVAKASAPTRSASTVTVTLSPAKVAYGAARSAIVKVVSAGKAATGSVTVLVNGASVKVTSLGGGQATVALSRTLAVGTYSVVATYAGNTTSAAATSAPAVLTVTKAATKIKLAKVSSATVTARTAAAIVTAAKVKSARHAVKVSLRVVGSRRPATGKVTIMINGHAARTISVTAARAGTIVVLLKGLPKHKTAKIWAKFHGSKNLKAATSKKVTYKSK